MAISADVEAEICGVDCYMWHQLYGNFDFCRDYFRKGVREVFDILSAAAKVRERLPPCEFIPFASLLTHTPRGSQQNNVHKLAILSAHDSSIVSLLKALRVDLPTDSVPWYGSHLCMETYVIPATGASFLKLILNGKPLVIGSSDSWAGASSSKTSENDTVTTASSSSTSSDDIVASGDEALTPFSEVESIIREFFAGTDA
jgi:hypothetical protein